MTPKLTRFEETLPRFSLGRRVSVLVLLASLVVLGVVATFGIPLELIPNGFSEPFLIVQVPWRDAPPPEVLEKIILPLEDELSTVRGLDEQFSLSRTGYGRVFLNFKVGTDMDVAYREVRDRIERARARLPSDADRILIFKQDTSAIPVYILGLTYDPSMGDPYQLLRHEVVMRLERLDGVASVEIQGLLEPEIFIELDRERTEASGLNIYQVAQDLGKDNFTMASGDVRWGDRKLLLRSVARFADLDAIRNRQISPHVKLSDIATVAYKSPKREFRIRANSRPAVALMVYKEGQANTIEVARAVQAEVDAMAERPRLQTIGMVPLFDQGAVIRESLQTLVNSGQIGGLFAALVLFFFLRRLRMTLIISLCIPLSLLAALAVMFFAGESLNIISLLGLMISVGLLVDNAVVVGENIHRLHREGLPRRQAAIRGAGEIALAVTTATLTTIIVFVPVSLVEGQGQFFLMRLALPISAALLSSLLIAGIFVPLSVYLTLKNGATTPVGPIRSLYDRGIAGLGRLYEATLGRLNREYTRLLGVCLNRRLDLVVVTLLVSIAVGFLATKTIKVVDMQEEERSGFEIEVHMPQGSTLEETEQFFLECEHKVESMKDELGLSGWFLFHRADHGSLQGFFNNPRTVKLSPREATEKMLEELPKKPGVRYFTGEEEQDEKKGQAVEVVTLWGEDAGILERTADDLEPIFAAVPGVLGLKAAADPPPSEIGLVVDRERAQQQQINPQVVAGVVSYALRGQQLARYRTGGDDIPVRVRFREDDRDDLTKLSSFYVPTGRGGFAPIASVTSVEHLQGVRSIFRRNKRIQRTITLELKDGQEEQARGRIASLKSELQLPEGVRFGDRLTSIHLGASDDIKAMQFAIAMSIVFIYLLMGFLFESAILPLSIITTIPLAGIGVVLAHIVTGYDLDGLGVVGIVLLVGVVVNNGIVLVDYANRLREAGAERREALLVAAERRFRPIMMTALTTICGMIPVTLAGANSIGLSYTSFGLTLIGGLTTATFLTLLVVPVFYTLFEDLRTLSVGLVKRALHGRQAPIPSGATEAP